MDTYKIAIDTFLAETSECKASGCAVFSGADIAFQDIQLHTHRNKSELHFMEQFIIKVSILFYTNMKDCIDLFLFQQVNCQS